MAAPPGLYLILSLCIILCYNLYSFIIFLVLQNQLPSYLQIKVLLIDVKYLPYVQK